MSCASCKKPAPKNNCVPCQPKPIKVTGVKFVIDTVHCEEPVQVCSVEAINLCKEKEHKKEKHYNENDYCGDGKAREKDDFSDCISGNYDGKQDCLSRAWLTTCTKRDCEDGTGKAYAYNF